MEEISKKYGINFTGYEQYFPLIIGIFNGGFDENILITQDSKIFNITGLYFFHVEKNDERAEELYLKSIDLGNSNAMNNLAGLKKKQGKIDEMKYWFDRGIECDNPFALRSLSTYYTFEEVNIEKVVELHRIGERLNIPFHIDNMGQHYYETGNI